MKILNCEVIKIFLVLNNSIGKLLIIFQTILNFVLILMNINRIIHETINIFFISLLYRYLKYKFKEIKNVTSLRLIF